MKYILLWYYSRKVKSRGHRIKIDKASTGSLYIKRRKKGGGHKDVLRISDHRPTHKKNKPVQTNRSGWTTKRICGYWVDYRKWIFE